MKARLYADFDIDQYWYAGDDTNNRSDIVRIVVEIASLNNYNNDCVDYNPKEVSTHCTSDIRRDSTNIQVKNPMT